MKILMNVRPLKQNRETLKSLSWQLYSVITLSDTLRSRERWRSICRRVRNVNAQYTCYLFQIFTFGTFIEHEV